MQKVHFQGSIQGSKANGPTFWNLILDSLLRELRELDVYVQAVADDVIFMFSGQSASSIEEDANRAFAHVHDFGVINKLRFALSKTNSMVLTRKLKYDDPVVHMNGVGCNKTTNIFKGLARMAKATWGLSPEIVRIIYISVIEPIVLAHAEVASNERADELARRAALTKKTAAGSDRFPLSHAKRVIRAVSLEKGKKDTPREARMKSPNAFFLGFKLKDSPYCTCDPAKEQNILHALEECNIFTRERADVEMKIDRRVKRQNFPEILENINHSFGKRFTLKKNESEKLKGSSGRAFVGVAVEQLKNSCTLG
ncbi:hypothetical protein EVAR_92276_1 [Eumeta japonica]|uniref:Reverse transcriptase domain-containing protein n=1 Tax=Eumeta variegata TaxID=151549 RepID=A0A4C1TLA5_EUMVA|nr:hypothetical protein EVAR_92276_1 [Eumeta japonica]